MDENAERLALELRSLRLGAISSKHADSRYQRLEQSFLQ